MKDDKQIIILELTSLCNSRCPDCLRVERKEENYTVKYEDFKIMIKEIKEFSKNFKNFEVKLSGGEPTLWKDGDKDIIDLIKLCEKEKLHWALVTNGKKLSFPNYAKEFFEKLKDIKNITIYVTLHFFHKNCDKLDNVILDNILEYSNNVSLYVQSTLTTKKENNVVLPIVYKYAERGVKFLLNPLLPWGRAKNLDQDIVPYLDLNSNNKSSLGDFEMYYYILGKSKNVWDTYDEYLNYNNFDAIKSLNSCGKTITFLKGNYYYCMPCSGMKEFAFSKIGELDYKKYLEFVKNNEYVNDMKNNKFDKYKIPKNCSIGYGICGLCRYIKENEK